MLVLVALVLTAIAVATLLWQMHAWWLPAHDDGTRYPPSRRRANADGYPRAAPRQAGVLVLADHAVPRGGGAVMEATLRALLAQSHPDVEVIISVGHDDLETVATAERLAARYAGVRVSVNHDPVGTKNKPKQLNDALLMCRNDIVGVFDAESVAAPDLLPTSTGSSRPAAPTWSRAPCTS